MRSSDPDEQQRGGNDAGERHALAAMDPFSDARYDVYWTPKPATLLDATPHRVAHPPNIVCVHDDRLRLVRAPQQFPFKLLAVPQKCGGRVNPTHRRGEHLFDGRELYTRPSARGAIGALECVEALPVGIRQRQRLARKDQRFSGARLGLAGRQVDATSRRVPATGVPDGSSHPRVAMTCPTTSWPFPDCAFPASSARPAAARGESASGARQLREQPGRRSGCM